MSLDISGHIKVSNHTCPNCNHEITETKEVFWKNITHNLRQMAREAKCDILWDCHGMKAWELIQPVRLSLVLLRDNPEKFNKFDVPNGWGTREQFIKFLEELLICLEEFPQAQLGISK